MKKRGSNKLAKGIKAIGTVLWLEEEKTAAIADLHLGYEEMLSNQGVLMPHINFADIKDRLEKTFAEIEQNSFFSTGKKPGKKRLLPMQKEPSSNFESQKQNFIEKIIINGDLKHEFGTISHQEWKEVLDMLEFFQEHCKEIILVQGNHDNILGPIAAFKKIKICKELFLEKSRILFCHGSEIQETEEFEKAKTIIIGHEHPAISLRDGTKIETYKCFLKGKFSGKDLIVMPSTSTIAYGTDVLKQEILSPFLKQDISEFEAWIIEDKIYYFGKLKNLH